MSPQKRPQYNPSCHVQPRDCNSDENSKKSRYMCCLFYVQTLVYLGREPSEIVKKIVTKLFL